MSDNGELTNVVDSFQGFTSFRSSSSAVIKHLHERLGFSLWMVTRVAGEDWIVLDAEDHGYSVADGDVFRWTDSFCSQMVQGRGPCIAPRSNDVPAYANAPIGRQVPIGAYLGVPLTWPDGTLFGTLCAIDPDRQPAGIVDELPHVEMLARMLSTILDAELQRDEQTRRAERAEAEAMADSLTGLYNRRGWDRLINAEELRCRRYGHEASVVSIDLDRLKEVNDRDGHDAGDALLKQMANVLQTVTRTSDIAARVGGDEFAVLATDSDQHSTQRLVERLEQSLVESGVAASIGFCQRRSPKTLDDAWKEADLRMYANKSQRKRNAIVAPT